MDIDTTIEGRERYKINVRYPRELRDDITKLKSVLVPISKKNREFFDRPAAVYEKTIHKTIDTMQRMEHVPLGLLGEIKAVMGAPMIKDEMGSLNGWGFVEMSDTDIGGYVMRAKEAVAQQLKLPEGYYVK